MFKKGSQKAQLLLTAAKRTAPGQIEELSRQLWMRVWSRVGWEREREGVGVHGGEDYWGLVILSPFLIYQDEDITTEESFREACIKAGLSLEQADELIGKISGEEIKEELKKTTQEALDLGVGRDYKI